MARQFIIVDPTDDLYLLISQYLSMGWHDADIDEASITTLLSDEPPEADIIIIGGIAADDPQLQEAMKKSQGGELSPMIYLNNAEEAEQEVNALTTSLPLEDLTPILLNGAIVELMKAHADGVVTRHAGGSKEDDEEEEQDLDAAYEKIEGLKNYHIIKELGRGGMAKVYLAEDKKDKGRRQVAIKVLDVSTIEDDRMIERFIREYAMLASVDSRHVARILDQTFTDEYAFIIMERFKGGDLTRRIRKGIATDDALDYLRQIGEGLKAIHAERIVHRDLKPGNILFRNDDSLALLDFGLAQMDDEDDLTKHGEVYGTPSYVSPEQARGKRVDNRSDIYSTGIIFYQMLTKKKPYRADNPMAMFYKHVHAELPKFPSKFSTYQPLLDKMLAKSVDDRFQNADELIAAIKEYQ